MDQQLYLVAQQADASSLLEACYADMRRVARRIMASDGIQAVMTPTDLAHEAAIRLIRNSPLDVNNREHMLALAAQSMRRALIDEVRKIHAAKRKAPTLMTSWPVSEKVPPVDLEALDEALTVLAGISTEYSQIVELRFSLGLSVSETAEATGMSERTIKRRWQTARAWLHDYLNQDQDGA